MRYQQKASTSVGTFIYSELIYQQRGARWHLQTLVPNLQNTAAQLQATSIPFFDYPTDIRKVIYTTNAIESINMSLRKIIKIRGSFPTDEAVFKLFFLALNNIVQKWTTPIPDWKAALNRVTIQFEERMPNN